MAAAKISDLPEPYRTRVRTSRNNVEFDEAWAEGLRALQMRLR